MANNIRSISVGIILIQTGNGVPTHVSSKGSIFIDLDVPVQYINKDGGGQWVVNSTGGLNISQDEYNAITGSTSPSTLNVFATINDLIAGSGDTKEVKISASDTTSGFLSSKISGSTNIDVSIFNSGSNETLIIKQNGLATLSGATFTGGVIAPSISSTTISATTYLNLPQTIPSITGITNSDNNITLTNVTGGTITTLFNTMTGLTVNGLIRSATISATTYQNLPISIDARVTGGTYSSGTTIFTNNTGGTFSVSGFFKPSDDIYMTGLTFNNSTYNLIGGRNDGTNFIANLSILASDMNVTGGTYNQSTGIASFTNNSGGTFNVSGFLTGMTDTYVTGLTYANNVLTLTNSAGGTINTLFNTMTGLTVNGLIRSATISATTYQNLPSTVVVTGVTNSNNNITLTNSTGGTINTLFNTMTGLTVNGLITSTTISATTYQNLPLQSTVVITGVTNGNNNITLTNSTGGTINTLFNTMTGLTVNGLVRSTTMSATTYQNLPSTVVITGVTNGNNVITLTNSTGGTINTLFNTMTGLTVNGLITSTTMSATTYQNLPISIDTRVTGGTYNAGTAIFTNNTGGTFSVSGFGGGGGGSFTGGTVNGPTNFTNGLTATTISATTYLNLPINIILTGGTYSSGTTTATFTNNTGGTFSVSGFSSSSGAGSSALIAMTELRATTLVTHTVVTSLTATAINLNSDGTNRFAKVVFIAPESGKVSIKMYFDAILTNSATNLRIGLHNLSTSTTTPTNGWFRVNGDDDGASNGYSAEFILTGLTAGNTHTRYFVACSDFASAFIRASSQQAGVFSVSDLPQSLKIKVEDLGSITILSNPNS